MCSRKHERAGKNPCLPRDLPMIAKYLSFRNLFSHSRSGTHRSVIPNLSSLL